MERGRSGGSLGRLCVGSLVAILAAALPVEAATPICDGTSTVSVLAMDTATGEVLFALPDTSSTGSWLVELDGTGSAAHGFHDAGRHFGGSVGPGPLLALLNCGSGCVQAERWQDHAWQQLGDRLPLPEASLAATSYDLNGAVWLIALTAAPQESERIAAAYRLENDHWQAHGSWTVSAVGQPQVGPAPMRKDGVVAGTGLFSASGVPETWTAGLPNLPLARQGQVLPLSGRAAAYVSADGLVYLSSDSGKAWGRSTWTPWETAEAVGAWRQGSDFSVDLPFGAHRGILQLVWFDRRNPSDEHLVLTRLGTDGVWKPLAQSTTDIRTKSGERLPVSQVLVPKPDHFILLSGCAATAGGSGLVLRSYENGAISAPRLVAIGLHP